MLAAAKARDLVRDLARAAVDGGPEDWTLGAARLSACDGRTWLLLDEGARVHTYAAGAAVSGAKGWLGANFAEPSGFVAAITSFHTDGRIRQRAVQALADAPARLRGAALAVRALDHVPQVRDEALQVLLARLDVEVAEPASGSCSLAASGRTPLPPWTPSALPCSPTCRGRLSSKCSSAANSAWFDVGGSTSRTTITCSTSIA